MTIGRDELWRLKAAEPQRFPFLLESVARGNPLARQDLLLEADPEREALIVGADGSGLAALLEAWSRQCLAPPGSGADLAPGGHALYLAYDFSAVFEPRVPRLPDRLGGPLAAWIPIRGLWRRDHAAGTLDWLLPDGSTAAAPEWPVSEDGADSLPPHRILEDAPGRFVHGVERVHRYLREGDSFQVNLSHAWSVDFAAPPSPAALYARLRRANPAPFAAWASVADLEILSSSPERLVAVHDGWAETRPIAGTRPRASDPAVDAQLRHELAVDAKERAEHIMLIDLERNDLGRVCEAGSVEVNELGAIESYTHVHHLVSNVRGRLRPGANLGELLRAVFPGGTITGCPKVRSMQIIAELEGQGRGPYTGSLGYVDPAGRLDLNILIRSFGLRGCHAEIRAGAGIVADSVSGRELEEVRAKARGVLRAFEWQA